MHDGGRVMPHLTRNGPGKWSNYHETVSVWAADRLDLARGANEDPDAEDYLAATASLVQGLFAEAVAKSHDMRPVGGHWSFSEMNRTDGAVLETRTSGCAFRVKAEAVDKGCGTDPTTLVLASGGLIIGELNTWLEAEGLSLLTSGASNGQSIAGAISTGTHGSVHSFGGMQNHVRGLHLVVSPTESVWIEPASAPALDGSFTSRFASRTIRDDALFGAAVVHLGGLGFVNAVLLEVAPIFMLEVVQKKQAIGLDWLAELERGEFRAVAARLGYDEEPYFHQIIVNPFAPFRKKALHRLLFKRPHRPAPLLALIDFGHLVDPLALLSELFEKFPLLRGPAIGAMMEALYDTIPDDPDHPLLQTWGQTTPPHKNVGKLFSASFAIPRERLTDALETMTGAFASAGGGDVVFTLRFVGPSIGTLAFTRFPENVVIDLDGFRSDASRRAAQAVAAALDAAKIPFGQHWGKMGVITPARVQADFGARVAEWRAQRAALLPGDMSAVFASAALRQWGLA